MQKGDGGHSSNFPLMRVMKVPYYEKLVASFSMSAIHDQLSPRE